MPYVPVARTPQSLVSWANVSALLTDLIKSAGFGVENSRGFNSLVLHGSGTGKVEVPFSVARSSKNRLAH